MEISKPKKTFIKKGKESMLNRLRPLNQQNIAVRSGSGNDVVGPEVFSSIGRLDAQQIDFCRAICIFIMITVHVYPFDGDNILRGGEYNGVYVLYVDFLGKASVALLSFFAGYILWIDRHKKSFGNLLESKFVTLYIPMVTWNVIFIVTIGIFYYINGGYEFINIKTYDFEGFNIVYYINYFFAVTEQPRNIPIGFLRDLFVSVILLRLAMPFIYKYGWMILVFLLLVSAFRVTEPFVLRANILLFVFAGAFAAAKDLSLNKLSSISVVFPIAVLLILFYGVAINMPLTGSLATEIPNILERAFLIVTFLALSRLFLARFPAPVVHKVRPVLFVAFLSHAVVTGALGGLWQISGIGTDDYRYIIFFFFNAPIAIAVAFILNRFINRMPKGAQLTLRGSSRT
jgi:hypothetical protein